MTCGMLRDMTRPKRTEYLQVRMSEAEMKQLRTLAERRGVSVADEIRRLIQLEVRRQEDKPE